MRVTPNTTSTPRSYEYKRADETQSRFIDVLDETKLVIRGGNQIKTVPTPSGEDTDYSSAMERFYNGKITHGSELGFYQAPVQPELIKVIQPDPTYAESIYDIPVSEWASLADTARDACNRINPSGMTKAELYNNVKSIFEDYLGKDFMEPYYTRSGYATKEFESITCIFSDFYGTLNEYGIKYDDSSTRIEASGYSGMSNDEIKTAVREKYPKAMTLRDCLVMSGELYELGVVPNNYGAALKDHMTTTISNTSSMASRNAEQIYEKLLDFPADYDQIVSEYYLYQQQQANYVINQNKLDPISRYLAFFKVSDSSLYTAKMQSDLQRLL